MRTLSSIEITQVSGGGSSDRDPGSRAEARINRYDIADRATLTTTLEKNNSTTFELEMNDHKFRANSGEELVKFTARSAAMALVSPFATPFVGVLAGQAASYGVGKLMEK